MLISSSARTVIPLFLAGALLGTPGLSSAAAPRGVTLRYEAPASCPTRQEFHDAVTRRLGHSIDFDDETSGSVASVRIATAAGSATAEVSFESPGVAANLRQFTTNSCGEAVEAAALVVALIIDPTIANAPSSATEPKPTEPGDAPAFRPPTAPKRAPSREARHATAPTDAHSWVAHSRLSFGAVVAPTLGVSPSVLFAGGARFGFDPAPNDRGSWSPHFALSALFARTGLIGAEADFGEITWFTSQLDGCSSKWPLTTTLTFRPCLSAQFGALSARGNDGAIARPSTATRFWSSAGVLPSLGLHLHPLDLRLGLGARAVFRAYEFVFENPYQSVYTTPNASFSLEFSANFEP